MQSKNKCKTYIISCIVCFCTKTFLFPHISLSAETTDANPPEQSQLHSNDTETTPVDYSIEDALLTENIWFGYCDEVSIATRHETSLVKAPSIITVITAEEIKNAGFRTFMDILSTVPGFAILKDPKFGTNYATVRGMDAFTRIRLMIDGHFILNHQRGEQFGTFFDDFPLAFIKKIEIIRGPGSAVYGENAFLAVINVITKDAKDIDGVMISSNYGSYDTVEGNILFGKKFGDFGVSGKIRYRNTNGYDGEIESDSVTIIDNALSPFGFSPASEAPGEVNDARQEYNLDLKIDYKDVYFRGWYTNKKWGDFVGPELALDDGTTIQVNTVFAEIGYKKILEDIITLRPRAYYDQHDMYSYFSAFPDGTTLAYDLDKDGAYETFQTYPDGLEAFINGVLRVTGMELPLDYQIFDGNILTLGMEFRIEHSELYNYYANIDPVTMAPLDGLQNLTDTYPIVPEKVTRRIWSYYIQDTWDITDALNLTVGCRYDTYNDFGENISPRAGISWAFTDKGTLKLLYGEAFRAPQFDAMYSKNQPTEAGNKDLDPEIIRTYELGLNYQFNKNLTGGINYFYNDIEDLIVIREVDAVDKIAQYDNYGDAHVHGIEAEAKMYFYEDNYLFMNYTFQDAQDDHGKNMPFVAKHKGNFGINVAPCRYVNTNLSTFVSGKRYREDEDSRDDMPSYTLVNFSVTAKKFFKTMEIYGSVYNLLDKDYNDPGPISLPDDLPRPGRTFSAGLSYKF